MLYLGGRSSRGELLNDLLGGHHVEGPGLLRVGDYLAGRQQEPVTPGVPQLDTVHIRDAGHAEGPVERGAGGCVEHAGDAAGLVILPVHREQSLVTAVSQGGQGIVTWCRGLRVSPGEEDELAVGVQGLVELDGKYYE